MLAFASRPVGASVGTQPPSRALAAALCEGVGGRAASSTLDHAHFAWRPLDQQRLSGADWAPCRSPDGRHVAFHGWIDNATDIAAQLGSDPGNPARLYGEALARWGDSADLRIVGEYCAVVHDPASGRVRLSRSPLRAPPLLYAQDEAAIAAASVPRAIFAAGFAKELDERRLADSNVLNFTDPEAAWYVGLSRVPEGCIVELAPGRPRRLVRYHDLARVPKVRLPSVEAYVARAHELLDEAVAAMVRPFSRPGATLSSGLDSPQVAARAARLMPAGQRLPTFTFHPEPGFDGGVPIGNLGDERPWVEAFCAMHPGLDPRFTDNRGHAHDHRWDDMFRAMEAAPSGLCNMYVFHGLFEGARAAGCDVLLVSDWGNATFSDKGDWAFVEYLVTGRWRQLWLALRDWPNDTRSMLRRFVAMSLVPLLPDSLWRLLMRVWHRGDRSALDMISPLRADYRESSGADRRRLDSGYEMNRYQPRSRAHACRLQFANTDGEAAEIYQAFELLYGVASRDPMAYRPFVEFCFGLPTDLFMRDGQPRWLAKEMARGIMPEEQRRNRLNGRWDADWLLRVRRRAGDYREQLDRAAEDPELAAMLDIPRLRAALDRLPERSPTDKQQIMPIQFALPRGVLTARFVNHVRGRN